jgi:hypothetical protein
LRIRVELRVTLEQLAAANRRSLSAYVEMVLEDHAAKTAGRK